MRVVKILEYPLRLIDTYIFSCIIKCSACFTVLAKEAGIHQKNISKYENEGVIPSAITLKAIADTLNVTTDYLLGSDHEEAIQDKVLLGYMKEVDKMPDNLKDAIITILDACVRDAKTRQAYAA